METILTTDKNNNSNDALKMIKNFKISIEKKINEFEKSLTNHKKKKSKNSDQNITSKAKKSTFEIKGKHDTKLISNIEHRLMISHTCKNIEHTQKPVKIDLSSQRKRFDEMVEPSLKSKFILLYGSCSLFFVQY